MDTQRFKAVEAEYIAADAPDPERPAELIGLVEQANKLEPGDYIELGTHIGLTLKLIHAAMDPKCTLYSFDTFNETFDERDLDVERRYITHRWDNTTFHPTSVEQVRKHLGCPANLRIIKGWFPESFKPFEISSALRFRFVHLDMDLYEPTRVALHTFWPRMVEGGIIACHDYTLIAGIRRALDEHCAFVGVKACVLRDRYGTAWIRRSSWV